MPEIKIIETADNRLRLEFPYDPALVAKVKELPGAKFDRATKTWTISACYRKRAEALAEEVSPAARMAKAQAARAATADAYKAVNANIAAKGEFMFQGLSFGDSDPFFHVSSPEDPEVTTILAPMGASYVAAQRWYTVPFSSVDLLREAAPVLPEAIRQAKRRAGRAQAEAIAAFNHHAVRDGGPVGLGAQFLVDTHYDPRIAALMRAIPGAAFDQTATRWRVPMVSLEAFRAVWPQIEKTIAKYKEMTEFRAEMQAKANPVLPPDVQRFLVLLSRVPKVGDVVRHVGKAVVVESIGKTFRVDEDAPSIHGSEFLGHKGEACAYAYYREATPRRPPLWRPRRPRPPHAARSPSLPPAWSTRSNNRARPSSWGASRRARCCGRIAAAPPTGSGRGSS